MAFVSPANMAMAVQEPMAEDLHEKHGSGDYTDAKHPLDVYEPQHGIAPDGHKPTLSEYQYYARIKREAELGGYSGNGSVSGCSNTLPPRC